jgi:hypothetical protein
METTELGITIDVNPEQEKASIPIVDIELGRLISDKLEHHKNAPSSIEVTELGIEIDAKL